MKKIILIMLAVFVSWKLSSANEDYDWSVEKSTHFIVHYKKATPDFVRELMDKSENYYNNIADGMGFRRFNFWLWDNRAKIYIYDDAPDYHAGTGFPVWSAGFADVKNKEIYTYPYARGFFDTILPHEMGHIIFREFVGFNNFRVPMWLDEGVACFQENGRSEKSNVMVMAAIEKGDFVPVQKLSFLNPQVMQDNHSVNLFYAEAVSVVNFLVKRFGNDSFISFCQRLRDGSSVEEAVRSSFNFNNLEELNEAWKKFLING